MASTASTSPPKNPFLVGVKHEEFPKLLEDSESTNVTVGSQDEAITWNLPTALLIDNSLFFAAALNGSFGEGKVNSVTMSDDDPNVFSYWVQWLYIGKVIWKVRFVENISSVLVKAWILGDKLGCHLFQDDVMVWLLNCHSPNREVNLIEPSTLRAAYEGSAPGSMLRKWAIDFFLFETRNKKTSSLQRNRLWYSEAKDIEDFARDYMEASMNCSLEGGPGNPYIMGDRYMVL